MQTSIEPSHRLRGRWPGLALALAFILQGCAGSATTPDRGAWNGRQVGSAPAPRPEIRRALISRATREWDLFGRQRVVFKGSEESIPHVGSWEDDDYTHSARVNLYWRAVGKPGLDGMDCRQPWSAAFMSYLMRGAGVPGNQFRPAAAHWVYLASMVERSGEPGRYFVPRRISDYSPEPGDLVCAYRPPSRPYLRDGYVSSRGLSGVASHCDLVVSKSGSTLDVIGGNVRNSVSRSTLELDSRGRVQPVPRRPWFLILQNRL